MDRDFRLWVWFYFPIVIGVGVGVWVVGLSFLVCFSPFGSLPLCSIGVLWLFLSPFWLWFPIVGLVVGLLFESILGALVLLCLGDTISSVHRTGKFSVFSMILSVFQCLVLILSIFCSYVLFAVYEFVVPKLFCSYVLFICAVCCVMNLSWSLLLCCSCV